MLARAVTRLVGRTGEQRVEVPCVTLDDLLAERSFGIPALAKIDAEGAELEIPPSGLRLVTETSAVLIVEFKHKVAHLNKHLAPGSDRGCSRSRTTCA